MSIDNIEINDKELKFNSYKGKMYRGKTELVGPLTISLVSSIQGQLQPEIPFYIEIKEARIFSEPLLFEPIILEPKSTNCEFTWEVPLIIHNQELRGEFPFELKFQYSYI